METRWEGMNDSNVNAPWVADCSSRRGPNWNGWASFVDLMQVPEM